MTKKGLFRTLALLALTAALTAALCPPALAASYTDVPSNHWAAPQIDRCAALGILRGETDTAFGLKKPMTRAAFAVALCRFFGWEADASAATPYTDVPAGKWYTGAVAAAYAKGALTTQRPTFRPNDPITREEMAVMLIRALGYGTIAGLAQDLQSPFTDVTTNDGYITMAHDLGLVTGTTASTFSPGATATREQAAVLLIRLYDKLHAAPPAAIGIAGSAGGDFTGFDAIAVDTGRLALAGKKAVYSTALGNKETSAIREGARAAGAKTLLYVSGRENLVQKADPAQVAGVISQAVEKGDYEGLFLDIPGVSAQNRSRFTALAAAVDAALGNKDFYLAADAPSLSTTGGAGYDHAALAALADRLVVRPASPQEKTGDFPVTPVEPLEEAYYALDSLRDIPNLTFLVTSGDSSGSYTGLEAEALAEEGAYYSERYGCAYLQRGRDTVWYLDGRACRERVQLLGFFAVDQLCLTDVSGAAPAQLAGLGIR